MISWLICWWRGHDWGAAQKFYEGQGLNGQQIYSWERQCRRCYESEDCNEQT